MTERVPHTGEIDCLIMHAARRGLEVDYAITLAVHFCEMHGYRYDPVRFAARFRWLAEHAIIRPALDRVDLLVLRPRGEDALQRIGERFSADEHEAILRAEIRYSEACEAKIPLDVKRLLAAQGSLPSQVERELLDRHRRTPHN